MGNVQRASQSNMRPRSPSLPPNPNKRHKTSDNNNTQLDTCNQTPQIPTPNIAIRPFTQIFADAMMVRQRLNASKTLNNIEDVRFYELCLDTIISEIEAYRNLQISMGGVRR